MLDVQLPSFLWTNISEIHEMTIMTHAQKKLQWKCLEVALWWDFRNIVFFCLKLLEMHLIKHNPQTTHNFIQFSVAAWRPVAHYKACVPRSSQQIKGGNLWLRKTGVILPDSSPWARRLTCQPQRWVHYCRRAREHAVWMWAAAWTAL